MLPFLTRLGISKDVQSFFLPFISVDEIGNLLFCYGDDFEHFGFAFHKVPATENIWMAGNENLSMISQVYICNSAMEAIAFLSFKAGLLTIRDNILFLGIGAKPYAAHIAWVLQHLPGRAYNLLFGNDLLGRISDLKFAAGINGLSVKVSFDQTNLVIKFRSKLYTLNPDEFTLNAFGKIAGHRFNIRTDKPKLHDSFLEQLKSIAFSHH